MVLTFLLLQVVGVLLHPQLRLHLHLLVVQDVLWEEAFMSQAAFHSKAQANVEKDKTTFSIS